jgi:phosphoesterase RecJ-like protein
LSALSSFAEFLQAHQSFLLTGHENPDGDCLGAQTALVHLLRSQGKQAWIVNPDPIGKSFDFLLRHTEFGSVRADQPLPPFEAAILLDCCQLSRLGTLGPRLREAGTPLGVIDHHVGSEHGDGTHNFVDATAAATGVLVRRLYREFGVPLSAAAAEGVFLSLISDTGWFRYSNTDAEVFAIASELVASGVDVSLVYDAMFRRRHADSTQLLVEALGTHRFVHGGKLAIAVMDRQRMERAGHIDFDPDQVMEPLRSTEGVEVVALIKERFDGTVKVSLRARADVDVQAIVQTWGGGGHKKAAGATLRMPLAEAIAAVESGVGRALSIGT